jgi:hypothetical protein
MACRFDAVSERMAAVEHALAEAQADRGIARRDRYAAWQAYDRASAMVTTPAPRPRVIERPGRMALPGTVNLG